MGQVADILNAPEWANKSALEKASARRDLFAISLAENPALQQQASVDPQGSYDAWSAKLETAFPKAFKVPGRFWSISDKAPGQANPEFRDVSIGDINTEALLDAANPATEEGRKYAKQFIEKSADQPEAQKAFRLAMAQRYGATGEDKFTTPKELTVDVKSRRVGGVYDYPILIPNVIRTAGAIGGSAAGGLLGSPTGPGAIASSALGGAGGAAIAEPIAQATEKALETRSEYGIGEGLLNVAMGGIPVIPVKGGGAILRGAIRAGEGAAQGGLYSAANQLILDNEPFSWKQVGIGAAAGAGIGGLLGGIEGKLAARFAGKSKQAVTEEIAKMLPEADEATKIQLTELQRRILEEAQVTPRTAQDSAEVFQSVPQPKSAQESAGVIGAAMDENAIRARDFDRARIEEVQQEVAARQAGGQSESLTFAPETSRDEIQRLAIEGRRGESARETARLDANIAAQRRAAAVESPTVYDEIADADLSPKASRMMEKYGRTRMPIVTSLAGGGVGAAAGSTQGDTLEERISNTIYGGLIGLGLGYGSGRALERMATAEGRALASQISGDLPALIERAPASMKDDLRYVQRELSDATKQLKSSSNALELQNRSTTPEGNINLRNQEAGSSQAVARGEPEVAQVSAEGQGALKPLPEGSTVEPLGKRYLVMEGVGEPIEQWQVKLPGEERGRTVTAEQLAAEGFETPGQAPVIETSAQVREKYPDILSSAPEGQLPVEIQRSDGTTYPAVINGYYELPSGSVASVGRMTDAGWSHGLLREGEKIVSEAPTAEQWASGVRDVAELRQPGVREIVAKDGFINPTLLRGLTAGASAMAAGGYGLTQGETAEERIKNGLTYAVLGAGGGYMAGRTMQRLAQQIPQRTNYPALNKWYKRLEKEAGPSVSERVRNLPNKMRQELTTSFAPLDKLPAQIAKANDTPLKAPSLPLSKQFELVNGASGKATVEASDFADSVLNQVRADEWRDFNAMLAIKRTGQRLQSKSNLEAEQARILSTPEGQRTPEEVTLLQQDPNRFRVSNETTASVDEALGQLRAKLGDKRFDELDQLAAGPMQQYMDRALRFLVSTGRMSEAQYAGIKTSNDFYAPFRVMQYAEDFDGFPGMKTNPVDTAQKYTHAMTGIDDPNFRIDDPAKVAMEKIFQAVMLGEKNLKMQTLAKLADEDASQTVIKKLGQGESAPRGMETVNYFDNGTPRQLAVAPDVAEAIKGMNPAATGVISQFVAKLNKPFRFGATAGNIGFQAVNAPADAFRQATLSRYGVGRGRPVVDTLRYPLDFVHALYSSILSRPSASSAVGAVGGFYTGYQTGDDTQEKWRNAAAGAVLGATAGRLGQRALMDTVEVLRNTSGQIPSAARQYGQTLGESIDPTTLYRDFYKSGAAGSTLQDLIDKLASERGKASVGQIAKGPGVLSTLQDFGRAVEETTKMMGFKRGVRIEGIDKLPQQQAYEKLQQVVSETRNFAGSPDFAVSGNLIKDLNAAVVFLNPRIQGMVEDGARLFGRDGVKAATQAWTALAGSVGLGAAYLWYRNNAPENKADYAQVSPDEKWRYAMIPRYDDQGQPLYFTNDRGERTREYYRIPLRDTAQNFYQMVQSSMDFAESKDPQAVSKFGMELTENLSPINIQGDNAKERVESVISSFGPVGTVPYMLATQRIPGLHRDIFSNDAMRQASPENQFMATTPEIYKTVSRLAPQWLADPLRSPMMLEQLASASTGGILSQFTPPRPTPGRDETATALQQSPLGRRFVRSTYNYNPAPEDARTAITGQADMSVTESRRGAEIFTQLSGLPMEQRRQVAQSLTPQDIAALQEEVARRERRPSSEEIALISRMQVENGVRARYILQQILKKPVEARREYVQALQESRYLTPKVLQQIDALAQQQAQRN